MPMHIHRLAFLALALVLVLAACGAPTNTPVPTPTPTPIDDDGDEDGGGDGSDPARPPSAPTLTLTPTAVKTFAFSWDTIDGATEYRLLEDPSGGASLEPIATLAGGETRYAHEVFLPERINARYRLDACNEFGCTESNFAGVTGTMAQAVGYVKAFDADADDQFGFSVALSDDGGTLAIGAWLEDGSATGIDGEPTDNGATDSGAVYVFARTGVGAWTQEAYVKASNTGANDWFGWSLALSGDGRTLAVGAPGEASDASGIDGDESRNAVFRAGAVYVFARGEDAWTQEAYVKASNPYDQAWFGSSVALSSNGDTLAVGSLGESGAATGIDGDQTPDFATSFYAGAVYLFERNRGDWSQQAYVKASNARGQAQFGYSVALAANGATLAVGAIGERSNATGVDGDQKDTSAVRAGAVYVFIRNLGVWSQQAYLKASNTDAEDLFGASVALSSTGNILAVGALSEASDAIGIDGDPSSNAAADAGAVYVFARTRAGWTHQAYVKASNTHEGARFGSQVALSGDGTVLAVGARGEDGNATGVDGTPSGDRATDAGAVYLFERSSADVWAQRSYVKASNTAAGHFFGTSVALARNGATLAVGAVGEASNARGVDGAQGDDSAPAAGAVYLY